MIAQIIAAINAGVVSIADAIAAVQAWIQDAVSELVGVFDVSANPTFTPPQFNLPWPALGSGAGSQGLNGSTHVGALEGILHDKAPFAYLFAFTDGVQQIGNSHSNPTFRVQRTFDILGQPLEIDINAEPWLLRDVGGTTIAQLLRSSVSITLSMGLLYGAYKTALAALKS